MSGIETGANNSEFEIAEEALEAAARLSNAETNGNRPEGCRTFLVLPNAPIIPVPEIAPTMEGN